MKVDPRFLTEQGPEVFTGNELLLKGCLEVEGGLHLMGGYPGSPIAGFFDAWALVKDLLTDKGIRAVVNNNEALAAAMLNGSQVAGVRGLICMKSVGVHVAADALALGSQSGPHPDGGAVIVYGDDPWSDSTQVPSDSRYISKHLFIPTVEPASPQEIKDYVDLAFKLSRGADLYVGYVLTNNLADGGGTVHCRPNQFPELNTLTPQAMVTRQIDLDKFVLLPPRTWQREELIAPRLDRAKRVAAELGLNRLEHPVTTGRVGVGFITSGLAHGYLRQVLDELGLLGRLPILKLGMSYPVDEALVRELARQCTRIVVVEERRGFIEEQVAEILTADRQAGQSWADVELWGKSFPFGLSGLPTTRGLHPSGLMERLGPLLRKLGDELLDEGSLARLDRAEAILAATSVAEAELGKLPPRLPSFCQGCPHRDSANVCLEIRKRFGNPHYMRSVHNRGPVDLLFHGDTGCYTMLMFPPNTELMHNYSGMGLGGGTGSGMDPFVTNKQVVFMGDSTFFHSGQIAISQAIKLGQDITFIILNNSTTAMTGHQPTPGVEYDMLGDPTACQDIEQIVHGIAGNNAVPIRRMDPSDRRAYKTMLEELFLADGVKVVIAEKECGITRTRRRRREERETVRQRGFLPVATHMNINPEVCRFCLACAEMTGCPGLRHVETDYGPKMATDITGCVNDGACERIGACWSFEQVTVKRSATPRSRLPELDLDNIPEPPARSFDQRWQCYLAGVGGMGIGLATSILVRAGHKEGYHVVFTDKKGLAIRNGGVHSQVIFSHGETPASGTIGYGQADLLLGVDILEATRALDPRSRSRVATPDRTAAVINTHKIQTIPGIMGRGDFNPEALERILRDHTREDDYLARDISHFCEKYLGSKIFANIMMVGFAFQRGLIPVSYHAMVWAIKDTIRADTRKNLTAFQMGRKLCQSPSLFQGAPQRTGWRETLEERCRWTIRRFGRSSGRDKALHTLAMESLDAMAGLDDRAKRDFVVRLYDCMRWDGLDYAARYAAGVRRVFGHDNAQQSYAATQAVIHNLADAMLIKDAVFTAELATSPEKYARDREKYGVNPANGDRVRYRHLLPVRTSLRGRPVHLEFWALPWMLRLVRRAKWLRKMPSAFAKARLRHRDRYEALVAEFAPASPADYRQALTRLSSPACMSCQNPRCQEAGCPLENAIPEWIDLANRGLWREACDRIHQTNNFPEFTGTLCPAPCQSQCKHAVRGYPVQIRSIEREIADRGFAEGWIQPAPPAERTGRKVAIVGSGPAGLTAAPQLARAGPGVTVFEKDPRPGGLLRYGIPDFRMDKDLLDRRLAQLEGEGVEFRTGTEIGKDVPVAQLREHFDAVLLALGAASPRDLAVPGREKAGIHFALDYLRQHNARGAGVAVPAEAAIDAKGKRVVVIGGGDTGADCAETALAQGAAEVHQVEIRPAEALATDPTHARSTAIRQHFGVATHQINGHGDGNELQLRQVRWLESPAGLRPEPLAGTDFALQADLTLLALGFEPAVSAALVKALGLATDDRGQVAVTDYATSVPGVFAAGDLASGASLIVQAIRTGRAAADRIDAYLQ